MRPTAVLAVFIAAIAGFIGLMLVYLGTPPSWIAPGQPRVKLAVLVVFDQMRGDYLEKWRPLFQPAGFVRLQTEGAWFTNCHYPYGVTTTGPGHASMLTGTCGDRHGIINNNWYERGAAVYCAGSDRYEIVPRSVASMLNRDTKSAKTEIGTPGRLLAETVADVLKSTHPDAKVFGLSLKDRSAILPTGKRPDGAYWFGSRFVTSTYYADTLRPWVEAFNNSKIADRWFGKDWTRFRDDIDYEKWSGPDSVDGEGSGVMVKDKKDPAYGWCQGVAFPHPNTGGRVKPGKEYYESLANSPFGNDLLLELAKACVTAERLGTHHVPDLLVISFSSNDLIGHTWGPDSQEVLDVTLRSDALMADFLSFLDAKVGRGQYLMAVTADHGICPLVEVSRSKGKDAKRVDPAALQIELEKHLTKQFGATAAPEGAKKAVWVASVVFPWVYFNSGVAKSAGKTLAQVAKAASEFFASHPDVARTFTRADLEARFPPEDLIGTLMQRSYYPARSGDLCVVLKEWYLPIKPRNPLTNSDDGSQTTHGSPFEYDTYVPLLVYGPGIAGGGRSEQVTPQATAAIFSKWLGLRLPNKAEFPVPTTLEKP